MRKISITLFLILFDLNVFAQVTSIPAFPTENDSIKIIFNAAEGGKGMMGYTGILYTHTGVKTNKSGGQWAHVIGNWGQNNIQPSLTRIGTDLYELVIGKPRQFYNITDPTEKIEQLAFVFRSENGSQQTEDLFLPLYEDGLNVSIISPVDQPYFAGLNDTVKVEVASNQSTNLALYLDDSLLIQTANSSISFNIIAAQYGKQWIKAVATGSDNSTIADSMYFVVNHPATIETKPGGIIYGINYTSNTSVTLNLYAPEKEFVYVIGDFNNWQVDPAYYMKLDPDQANYWLEITGLETGKEYIFQYFVDGEIRIADPYTEKTSDPNDRFISSQVYPNLIPYPDGKTSEIASVLQTAQQPYQWEITDFDRHKETDLVIYELLIRDFLAAHSYNVLIDTLGYLKRLGVNAIELMPVMEFEGNESWGYNSSLHFAPDKYYGTKDDLKRFVDEAHKQGFAVIIDIVLNHVYGQSPLVRLYWNSALNRPAANNPWFNEVSPNQVFSFGFDFNHESQLTKDYIDRVNKYWLEEFNVDGFRFDFTKGMTNKPGDGGAFDQSRINILKRMADELWKVDSSAYVILEHFAANDEEIVLSNYGMMLWGNLNHSYNEATMGYIPGSNFSGISYKERNWQNPYLVGYMESHDEERLMYKNLQFGNANTNYNVKDLQTALQRIKIAAAFFFTIPGPKMIWQFGELGYDVSINFNGRVGNKPIRWNYYNEPARNKLYKTFAALTALKQYDAFESEDFSVSASGWIKRIQIRHESMDVYILGNFEITPRTTNHTFSKTGYWYNYFSGDSILVADSTAQVTLEPGEFHIYTTVKLPTPEVDILTDISVETDEQTVTSFMLEQNYPNPFNPTTSIQYAVSSKQFISLKVYDVLGNEISSLVNEEKTAGVYIIQFDASALSSGVYFYKLQAGNFSETKKMILLR